MVEKNVYAVFKRPPARFYFEKKTFFDLFVVKNLTHLLIPLGGCIKQ